MTSPLKQVISVKSLLLLRNASYIADGSSIHLIAIYLPASVQRYSVFRQKTGVLCQALKSSSEKRLNPNFPG